MNEQEVKKLYQALLSKGYSTQDLGDEQRFLSKMSDAGNRKQLYDWVSSRGNFRIGDFDAYESRLTSGAQQPVPQPAQPAVKAEDGYKFTSAGLDSLERGYQVNSAPASTEAPVQSQQAAKQVTPQVKPVITQPVAAEEPQEDEATKQARIADELKSAESDLAGINEQLSKLGHGNITRYGAGFGAPMPADETAKGKRRDQLLSAKRQAEDRIHTLKESRDKNKSGFWRNLWHTVTNPSTWSFGLIPLSDALTANDMAKKVENESPLSNEEQTLLQQMVMTDEAREKYGQDMGFMARAGEITGEALPFVGEFLLTGGFSGAAEATAGAVTRGLAKATATDLTKKGVRSWLVKSTGTVAGDVVGATLMANTTGAAKTMSDAMDRHRGSIIQDENGDYHLGHYEEDENGDVKFVDGGKTWAKSIYEAEAANTLEYYTEMLGTHMEKPLEAVGAWLAEKTGAKKAGAYMISKLGLGEVSKDLSQITANGYGRAMKHVLERGGIQDYPSEVLEEEANIILNSMLVGDNSLSDLVDGRTQADIWGGMLFSVGFMNTPAIAGGAVDASSYLRTKHNLDNADKLASFRLTDEKWRPLRERIDETTNENFADLAAEILYDEGMHAEEKRAALDYMGQLAKFRGFNVGTTAKAKDDMEAEDGGSATNGLNTSYIGGYNAGDGQMNDIKNGYDFQRQRAQERFNDTAMLDGDPIGTIMTMQGDNFTDEDRQVAVDYVNAKAAYDGMIQRVRDDIDSRLALSDAMIVGRQHKDDGMIHPATMKMNDRKVYVVGGNIVMNDDGTMVDHIKSDESVIIRDAETGAIEFADPRDVLSIDEAIDAEQEKQTAQEAIRQQFAQEAANKIDGVLSFNEGDQYNVVDDDGVQHTVTVMPTPVGETDGNTTPLGEGEVLVSFDGGEVIPATKEFVQGMADNANLARLQQFEQERAAAMAQQAAEQHEATRPVYNINDEITLQTDEGVVRGSITAEANEDGLIEVYTESPIGGKKINLYNRDQLDSMVVEHNGEIQEGARAGGEASPEQTGANEPPANTPTTEPMPMVGEGEDAEPDFSRATPVRAHTYIYNEAGLNREEANQFVDANKKAADKELEKAKEKKPKMGTSLAKYKKEQAEWQSKVDAAQQKADYWKQVKDEQRKVAEAEAAERAAAQSQLTEQAIAEEQARQAEELRKREEQAALGSNNVAPAIREKWEASPKVEGARNEIALANGERVAGRYMLVESGAATPSHNPNMEFAKNEGFPVDENGQSVNDRDYERDKDAQSTTRNIAQSYDQRALQTPVVVTNDGIVLSGNGRTMAGELAAQGGTDGAYIEHLKKYGQQFGFTPEQVEGMQHPRVVFVPDETMPYTAETFAKFNAQEMKGQSKTEQAVKLGKVVGDDTFGRIIRSINGYNTLGDFYADPSATTEAINELRSAGAISQAQYTEMFDGDAISAQGREILENMLIGKAFESNPDAVRQITSFKSIRQSVITALAEISNNIMLGKEYSLESELAQAINLAYQARQSGYKAGDQVSGFARQGNLFQFDEGVTVADYTNATVLMLADVLNDNRTTLLKKTLALYNQSAKDSANGQLDIFSGGVKSRDNILTEVKELLQYGTEAEQQAAIDAATAERRAEAGTGVQEDGTTGAGRQGSEGVERAIQGIDGYSEDEVLNAIRGDIEMKLEEAGIEGVIIKGMALHGSRMRGDARNDSDLDVVVEYEGDISEDGLFNILNEQPIEIEGIRVDVNPITNGKSGTLEQYMERSRQYDALKQAEREVDTNPSEAQKEAGNYKKGHVKIDGYDVTIENPKGSERSGTDASGHEWRQTMHNTYGYIRGTEGVDGDHIDVFLSDAPEIGNVYVVDQVNKDGSFDEHKVMYGFNSVEEAREAYLSNYEEGWQGLGAITPVSKEEFKKWIESSHRKTKPFAEYKSVKPLDESRYHVGEQFDIIDDSGERHLSRIVSIDEQGNIELIVGWHGDNYRQTVTPEELDELRQRYETSVLRDELIMFVANVVDDGDETFIEKMSPYEIREFNRIVNEWDFYESNADSTGKAGEAWEKIERFVSDMRAKYPVEASEQLKPTDLRDAVRPESAKLGVNESNTKARGVFEYFKGTLKELVELGKKAGNVLQKMVLVPTVSERLKSDLSSKGVDLDAPYRHTIDNFAIKHTFNEHASEDEKLRGQVPITEADFNLATDVIENYDEISIDKNKRNQYIILYKKQYPDGRIIYVEEVRSPKKGELAFVSMRKYQAKESGLPNEAEASTLGSSAGTLTDANRETTPISDLSGSETPEQQALLNGNNPRQYPAEGQPSGRKSSNNTESEQGKVEKNGFSYSKKDYTTKKGKVLHMQLVKFDGELDKEQQRKANALAKKWGGWWSREDGGFMMRDEDSADLFGRTVLDAEALEDEQPMSKSEMAAATELAQTITPAREEATVELEPTQEQQGDNLDGQTAEHTTPKSKWVDDEDADRFEELKRRMRNKLGGQMNMGVDPEILAIGTEMAFYIIKHGAHKFGEYAKAMVDELGDAIRPYLKAFYNGAREFPEMEEYAKDMTPYEEVRQFDVLSLDGKTAENTPTVFEKAEEIAKEQDAEQQAEEAQAQLEGQRNDVRKAAGTEGLMRPATEADLEDAHPIVYWQGKPYNIVAVMRQGEQISATQFSKPRVGSVMLTNGKSVKLEELSVIDGENAKIAERLNELKEEREKSTDETVKKRKERWQSKKKDLSLQQEPDLFGDFFGEEASNVESSNSSNNDEGRENRPSSTGVSQRAPERSGRADSGRLDSDIQEGGNDREGDSSVSPAATGERSGSGRPAGSVQGVRQQAERPTNPKNTHNNHAERGKDYAPKGVDARIEANIKAIELMQQLMESGEQATPEQMAVLRQFSGWGGLGKAFESYTAYTNGKPTPQYLRELLGEEAYQQANMSRNSAYYTPAGVIDTMWDIARTMGFTGGRVLEGSAGIGNILGLMPTDMSERSSIQAVEIDQTTGNILKLLYPDANVEVQGFEATQIPNGSIDLAITNVPFVTGLRVNDTTGDKDLSKKFRDIHDFCIAKNIRKLREGGIGIFITSSGTLDNSARLREWIIQEGGADVVGAFRLNNETFGGTGATSDIIVVRKRENGKKSPYAIDVLPTTGERTAEYDTGESKRVKGEEIPIVKKLSMDYNGYFVEHPEMMAGEMHFGFEMGETFRPTSKALYPVKGKNQAQMLADWVRTFEGKDWESSSLGELPDDAVDVYEDLGEGVKEGSIVVSNGQLCIAQRGKAVPLAVNANKVKGHTKVECFQAYQGIKQALAELLEYQTMNEDDGDLQPLLKALNKAYDQFVRTYGHLHKNTSISFLKSDVDFPNILALESFSERGDAKTGKRIQEYGKTDIFSRRVVSKEKSPDPKNVKDAIIASIYVHGRIDLPWMVDRLNEHAGETAMHTEQQVRDEIVASGLGFENPVSRQMEVSYEYLSGNVREKLAQAQANNSDGRYDANIKALEAVIPMNIPAHLIDFNIGSSWIDPKLYAEYVKEKTDIDVTFTSVGGTWIMRAPHFVGEQKNRAMGVVSEMLHKTIMGTQLIEAAMQNKTIEVSETRKNWDGTTEKVTDKEATQACANKIDEIRSDFRDWTRAKMQSDPVLSEQLEHTYNEVFNNYVPRTIPDEFVPEHFGGAATVVEGRPFALRPHQGKAVVRATTQPLLLAHEVGTGKTYTLITAAMEMRRLGTARKPMIVVQNATVGQFVESAKKLFPNAKVLTLEERDHTGEGRKNFYAKIKYNDWDMIVVPQSVFERIPDSEERQMAFVQDKIEEKLKSLELLRESDPNSIIVKQAEREIEKLEDELANLSEAISNKRKERDAKKEAVTRQNAEVRALEMLDRQTDDVEDFDDMGIDAILVDEAHEYKHLGFATAMQRGVKGVDPSYSKKAQGVYLKTQAVLEKNNGRNVVFATGTPISNTAAEIWTFMRYLMPADTMKEYGIYYFDDFVRNFGNLQQMLEFTTSGKFKENNRFAGYVNLPELVRIWAGVADTVLTREAGGVNDKIPEIEGGKAQDIYLPQTRALRSVMKFVKKELERFDNMTGKEKKLHSHIPLTMYGIAKAAAVDARLVVGDAADEPQSKTNEAVRQTLKSLSETEAYHGTVALFADNYQNKMSGFNLYEDIRKKLIEAGVPAEQIVVMKSGMSVKKKLEIFDMVNRGEIRVIMGSTFTLGTGVNIQERLHTLIHLDAPNRPMDYTQRNGRILRQGNLHKEMGKAVRVLRFGVEDSLDVTAYQRLKTKGAIADSIMNGKQMMNNSMENRALEEEEDVFGDTVAQLSGSEYAMLKNQAEKDVRKYEAKRKQWEADQTYCHHEIPRLEKEIKEIQERIELDRKNLGLVEGKPTSITVGKQTFESMEAMADFIKDYNKKIKDVEISLREDPSMQSQQRTLTVNVGGLDFVITTDMTVEAWEEKQGSLFTAIHRKMRYNCDALGMYGVPVHQSLLREALEDIIGNVMNGKDFREDIERCERMLAKDERTLEQVRERDGKPFEHEAELAQAHERYDEYAELMKKELEEKEKKYAEMDSNVEEADDITEAEEAEEEEDDDADVRFRDGEEETEEDGDVRFREVSDEETIEWLENQPTVKVYRSMVLIDGKLYPPMSSKEASGKQLRKPSEIGKWEEAEEAPEKAVKKNGKWVFPLRKDNGKMLYAAYNPYIHTSRTMLNDQFSEAQDRDNLVVVEMEVPVSELTSEYRADRAKDTTGVKQWKAGIIQGQLSGARKVILTRWAKPVRIVPVDEVADHIANMLAGHVDVMPSNVVTPQQREALEARGVKFVETNNQGKLVEGKDSGKSWKSVYGRNASRENRDAQYSRNRDGEPAARMTYEESLAASRAAGYTKRQHDAYAERMWRHMMREAEHTISALGLDGLVTIREDGSGLKGRKARAKGWYDTKTGKIVIILGNHGSVSDVAKTLMHEGVAHYGLRAMFGRRFDQFLDNVFQFAEEDVRARIVELAKKHNWDFREATEEYLARLAENTDFERADGSGWWAKIKSLFLDFMHSLGLGYYVGSSISDNELRYILWRSYQNLAAPLRYNNLFAEAEDISKQMELRVGRFEKIRAKEHKETLKRAARYKREHDRIQRTGLTDTSVFPVAAERFRDGDFSGRDRATARDAYERMVASGTYQFREAVQDSMLGLKKLYEAILGGKTTKHTTRIEDVEGYENAYLAENRMSSVNAAEQHDYYIHFMRPLLEAIGAIAGSRKAARQELTDYMMAKHGLERNLVFAERDARVAEANGEDFNTAYKKFREKDYSGLTALTGEDDLAAAEAAAQQMVDDYEAAYDTNDLWDRTREATHATLEKIYRSGLLSTERYEQIRDMFEYYIPLQGWDETTSDEVYGYLTSKSGPFGSPIKHAVGRSSKADDPIATIAMMADSAIRTGNRNQMKQRFLNFVLNNPSDLVSVNDLWLEYDAASDSWTPVFADLEDGDTASDVERKVEAFEQRMEQLAQAEPDRYKRGKDAKNIPYKVVKGNLREHQVLVKRGGQTYVLTINGSPRAAQALNGLTNPDVETGGVVGNLLKAGEWVNRNLSAFYTTRNPDFVVSNFFRDMLYSNCMTWVKENPRYALRYHKNFGKLNPVMIRRLLGKWEEGTLDQSNYTERMFYQFMMNGGETGYTSVRDIEEHKKSIADELKKQESAGRRAWSALGMQLDLLNRGVENCARFAAFVTSREMGRSIDRSIYDAKEVSVNFNKKGSGGKMVNATGQTFLGKVGSYVGGGGRVAYVFWNAGVQGLTNFGRAGKRHKGKAFAGAASMFILGYVIPQLAAAMGGGDGDDDDKNAYYNLPEYVRRSNICFRVGEQWVTIPLPIEFRGIYGLGELASGVISGNEYYDNKEMAYQIASQVSQVLPLDMLEGGGGVSPMIPSAMKPYAEAYIMNKSWTGLPIYKDTPWNQNDPEWTKAYKNADQTLVGASRWLNEATGGDDFKKGIIDINPSKVEYLLNGIFGGYMNTAEKLKKMGETAVGYREFDWRNMLLANRVVKSGDERTANRKLQNEYFKYKKEYEETSRLMRKYEGAADEGISGMAEKADFLYNSKEYLRYELFDEYKSDIDDYRDEMKEATDEAERKEIEAEMFATMRELIDQLHEIK